ncbi:hypothetical protein ACQKQD_33250 [Methylobacterium sp. NPDC080182]|uniref:hypothetical protein n=1 Tax=Methylobacterium sp. NPDC080182 TaxID=3390590 RepID=UPI003D077D3D
MSKPKHWLAPITDIFSASTGDLRKLALIAGEDPSYFYIGTSLKGTDLRGQDLRGMNISRAQIDGAIIDCKTRFDWPAEDNTPDNARKILEYTIMAPNGLRNFPQSQDLERRGLNFKLFDINTETEFIETIRTYDGPIFVILENSTKGMIRNYSDKYGRDIVYIVLKRGDFSFLTERDFNDATSARGKVVVIPIPKFLGAKPAPVFSGAVGDLIALFCANWDSIINNEHIPPLSVFFRSRGNGTRKIEDAWCRILSSVQRSDLVGYPGTEIVDKDVPFNHDRQDVSDAIFGKLSKLQLSMPGSLLTRVDAALLIDPSSPYRNVKTAYENSVIGLLGFLDLKLLRDDAPHHLGDHWIISGQNHKFNLFFDEPPPKPMAGTTLPEGRVPYIDFERFHDFFVSEEIGDTTAVIEIAENNRLWVSARDFLATQAHDLSIWSIIAQQCRRIGRSSNTAARTMYFAMLLRSTLSSIVDSSPDSIILEDILSADDFLNNYTIKCGKFVVTTTDVTLAAQIYGQPSADTIEDLPRISIQLMINSIGVNIIKCRVPRSRLG